jgi:hypothetical protein
MLSGLGMHTGSVGGSKKMILKIFHIIAAALLVALAVAQGVQAETYKGNELPSYDVIEQSGPIEIRRYAPQIVAEVTVSGSRSNAVNRGFSILSNYIFGDNASRTQISVNSALPATSEKIAMTVPVTQNQSDQGWVIRFMMPSEYSLDTLPIPRSKAIRLIEVPQETQLVFVFSGFPGSLRLTRNETMLRNYAREADIPIEGPPRYYFYDGPMTFPSQRRNEIAFLIGDLN